ncbi:MAG TPA: helix-turn-helix transcriptional regulator [Polyangiaceae bacterium]|nr:helix-turn-helix transcriptional regulator [Polyangiaceae bacterium]
MNVNWLDVIDAAYRTDGPDEAWLESVMGAALPMMSRGLGAVGVLYDASQDGVFVAQHFATAGFPWPVTPELCRELLETGDSGAPYVQELFGQVQCGLVSATFSRCFPKLLAFTADKGAADIVAINGTDPTLRGCILTANVPDSTPIDPATQLFWSRLSAHLAAAYRLRRRLRQAGVDLIDSADAILTPDARLQHANESAQQREVRELLSETVRAQERLRVKKRQQDPTAVGEWKALVDARWSLVNHVDSDGKRTIMAQRNQSVQAGGLGLSRREEQVLACAALGHSNKLIAYELGLAHSTVRVLLARASSKLGARGREEALKQFHARSK